MHFRRLSLKSLQNLGWKVSHRYKYLTCHAKIWKSGKGERESGKGDLMKKATMAL